jgi:hypothetical protein
MRKGSGWVVAKQEVSPDDAMLDGLHGIPSRSGRSLARHMAELAAAMANVAQTPGVRVPMCGSHSVAGFMGEYADAHFARMRKRTKHPGRSAHNGRYSSPIGRRRNQLRVA